MPGFRGQKKVGEIPGVRKKFNQIFRSGHYLQGGRWKSENRPLTQSHTWIYNRGLRFHLHSKVVH